MLVPRKYLHDYNNFYLDNSACLVVFSWTVEYSRLSTIHHNENKKVSIFLINITYWYTSIFYLIDLCINIHLSSSSHQIP